MTHGLVKIACCVAAAMFSSSPVLAQDLSPRAYVVTPVRTNAVNVTYSYFHGGLNFNGTIPVSGITGTYSVPVFSLYHSFNFFGRSANITGSLPYAVGTFQGEVLGSPTQVYRSGLVDSGYRLSINLKGGPAMQIKEFARWKQKVLLGASLRVVAPTGQYDSSKVINWGINRWAFKPEFGYSHRLNKWVVDGYAGVWFYTTNHAAFAGPYPGTQTQTPVGSFEGHLSRDLGKRRYWVSLDGNFWFGGIASLNAVQNLATRQTSSRIGGTASIPINRHQSIKFNYSVGTYARFGGNYHSVSVSWQYSWIGRHLK